MSKYLIAIFFACGAFAAGDIGPAVPVTGGQIRGRLIPGHPGAVFRGIPFAQPPTGVLRWREPQPVQPWSGTRDAGESGPPCTQTHAGWNEREAIASREDCLYLDVWAPEWPPKASRPVMFWIHGGGNTAGAGASDPLYDGARLIRHGVVLVIAEHRLGVFGFLAHPELSRESPYHVSGNYILLDQIAALQWVRDNIARFGGDPNNVTVFGQSAGAFSLSALMTSPLAKGLFHRAIAQSGNAATSSASLAAEAEQAGVRFAESFKAPPDGAITYLRSLPATDLLKARSFGGAVLDGRTFTANPRDVFASGKAHSVPLLIGTNAIEIGSQGSPEELRKTVQTRFGDRASDVLTLYGLAQPGDTGRADPLYGGLNDQFGTDMGFRCPALLQAMWHSAGNPTWIYQFDRAIPPKPTPIHSSELPYVFGNLWPTGSQAGKFEEADRRLSDAMQTYWTNFAKSGDPNGPGVPAWPRFDGSTRQYLEFTATGGLAVSQNQRGAFCDLFVEAIKAMMKQQ